MASTSRLPTLPEVEALKDEQLRAAREGRDPQWNNISEIMADNIPEENLIWGSKGQRLETKEGRYTTKGHSEKTDELLGMNDVVEGSPNVPQSTYDEAVEAQKEYLDNLHEYEAERERQGLYSPHQRRPQFELVETPKPPAKKTAKKASSDK